MMQFDETIEQILEDLSAQGESGITQMGGNIQPQQSSVPSSGQATRMPSTKMKFSKGPTSPQTAGQPNINQQALVGKDGKPLMGQDGKLFDINLAQSNPEQFYKAISQFSPDDQQMVQQTVAQMFGNK